MRTRLWKYWVTLSRSKQNVSLLFFLNFKINIQIPAYLRQEEIKSIRESSAWMIATSLISLFSAALLIWILIYIYKQKWVLHHVNCAKTFKHCSREARRSTTS